MYILLCGYPPFYGESRKDILIEVRKGDLRFEGPEWEGKSKKVLNLIKKLIVGHKKRLFAEQIFMHS